MNKLKQINPKELPHIENKMIREVYYKSRQAYENQRGFFLYCNLLFREKLDDISKFV